MRKCRKSSGTRDKTHEKDRESRKKQEQRIHV